MAARIRDIFSWYVYNEILKNKTKKQKKKNKKKLELQLLDFKITLQECALWYPL